MLDSDRASHRSPPIALAVGPGDAWAWRTSSGSPDQLADYEIRYVEVAGGQVSPPEKVATVQRVYGVSVAFDANGRPAVSVPGRRQRTTAAFWFQSDLAVAYRTAPTAAGRRASR